MRDYVQLTRFPNVFTALADVTMGFLFVHAGLRPLETYFCLAAASMTLYMAGMVLNDVWDVEQDRQERPSRPIAAGRIPLVQARRVGFGLLCSGVVLGWAAGYVASIEWATAWRSGLAATMLALLIVLYDAHIKRTPLGPLAMGGCRSLNVLLGMSLIGSESTSALLPGFSAVQLLVAGGVGLYIAGVTWFARREARTSTRWQLAAAMAVMVGGIGLLGLVYQGLPTETPRMIAHEATWWLLLGLLTFTIIRRCVMAFFDPSPRRVQLAVTNAIWSLIVLDAAVVLLACHFAWALLVVAFLLPTMFLGRWVEST
ncbi:MAG: UbiA family prenyltransferase [Planctomycetota bacterium]